MLKAINNNVFIERFPPETTHNGMEVSEKALTKNFRGIIRTIENDKFVTIGDEVLIPHYGVTDFEFDGVEYARTKVERLFAVKNGSGYRPINRYVKVRKCENDHILDSTGEVALYMTENHIENTNWVEVLEVAGDCKTITSKYIGYYCVAPENSELLARIGYTKDFCMHESLIEFLTSGE
jgi:co-chaperonin GroES (HSP10)